MKPALTLPFVLALACATAVAQQPTATPAPAPHPGSIASHPDWPKAKPEDVNSIDAIVSALYNVISGTKGQPRDWDRMRSLFIPDARLIPARVNAETHQAAAAIYTIDGYIAAAGKIMATEGFFEHGVRNQVEQFGNIAHVWSTYESRHSPDDPQPFARGINSIQLLKSGDRYYIIQVVWDAERPNSPIPQKYLPN